MRINRDHFLPYSMQFCLDHTRYHFSFFWSFEWKRSFIFFSFFLGLLRVRKRFGRYSGPKETTGLRNTRQFLCRYTRTSEPLIVFESSLKDDWWTLLKCNLMSPRIKVTRQNHPLRHSTSMSSTRMTKILPFKVTNTKFSFLETLKRYTIFIIIIIINNPLRSNSISDNIYLWSIFLEYRFVNWFLNSLHIILWNVE